MKKPVRKPVRKRRGYSDGGTITQRSLADQDETYAEKLPGITSGPAPKPWGLNRDQPLTKPQPTHESGFIKNTLDRVRPSDETIDPKSVITRAYRRGLGSADPMVGHGRAANPYPGSYTADNPDESYAKGGKVRKVIKKIIKKKARAR